MLYVAKIWEKQIGDSETNFENSLTSWSWKKKKEDSFSNDYINGYDKLKLYGMTIHTANETMVSVAKILSLKLGMSNNNLKVIGGYYSDCVKELNLIPPANRADRRTEIVKICDI